MSPLYSNPEDELDDSEREQKLLTNIKWYEDNAKRNRRSANNYENMIDTDPETGRQRRRGPYHRTEALRLAADAYDAQAERLRREYEGEQESIGLEPVAPPQAPARRRRTQPAMQEGFTE